MTTQVSGQLNSGKCGLRARYLKRTGYRNTRLLSDNVSKLERILEFKQIKILEIDEIALKKGYWDYALI